MRTAAVPAANVLRVRVLSALAMAAVLLLVLFALPPWGTVALMTIVVLAGAWEWGALWSGGARSGRIAAVVIVALALPFIWQLAATQSGLRLLLWISALWWTAALLWLLLAPQQVPRVSVAVAGLLSLLPTWAAVVHLRTDPPNGAAWLLFALMIVFAADIGAYFAGRAFGRVKLAPRVSPGKTWEGVGGGLLLSIVVALIGGKVMGIDARMSGMLAAVAAAAYSIVGDLTESMFKRHAGLKDSGSLLPGHGGVLDRVDSICAGVPVLLLCWLQFEVLP